MQIKLNEAVVTEQGFRALFPAVSMPSPLSEEVINSFGGAIIFEGPQATGGTVYQYSVYGGIEQVNGKWFTKWNLGPSFFDTEDIDGVVTTAAEAEAAHKAMKDAEKAKGVRDQRGVLLRDSDWTQVLDAPVDQPAWAAYRQALRDVTKQAGFPWTVESPTTPA
jgi:hypothetical protein